MAHYRFSDKGFTKYVGPANDKAFDKTKKPSNFYKKFSGASGVCAGVLINAWSIGYSSIGEAVLHNLPVPLFKQNARQTKPIKAGNFRIITVALYFSCVDLPLVLVFLMIGSCRDQLDCICDA